MVSGGYGQDERGMDSVELLKMDGTWICSMPAMPEARWGHTQTERIACGGYGPAATARKSLKSCLTFKSGGDDWVKTHTLKHDRWYHIAWTSTYGVMLVGGFRKSAKKRAEILLPWDNGDSILGFTLRTHGTS